MPKRKKRKSIFTVRKRKKQKALAKVTSLPSKEAASMIGAARSSKPFPLIVVTTDASGLDECSGLAAILRKINTSDGFDSCKTVLGRFRWDESGAAESGAISLACTGLLDENEDLKDHTILFLADCKEALTFYDLTKKNRLRDTLVHADAWMKNFDDLRGRVKEVFITKVGSNHSKQLGFFDHEAADFLADKARNREYVEKHGKENNQWFNEVPPLDDVSIEWLNLSETRKKPNGGGKAERKERCERRIRTDFNVTCFSI